MKRNSTRMGSEHFNFIFRKVAKLAPAANADLATDAALSVLAPLTTPRPKDDVIEVAIDALTNGTITAAFAASASCGWRDRFAAGAYLAAVHSVLRFCCPTSNQGKFGGLFDELLNARADALNFCNVLTSDTDGGRPLANAARGQLATALCYLLAKVRKQRRKVIAGLYANTSEPTTADVIEKFQALQKEFANTAAAATAAANNSQDAKTAAETLLVLKQQGTKKRSECGKAAQAKGVNAAEIKRAADDKTTALNRVDDRVKDGEQVLAACRAVCRRFKKVGGSGKFGNETWLPLTGWNGNEIMPETLAKNYRTRFGTKKAKRDRGTK